MWKMLFFYDLINYVFLIFLSLYGSFLVLNWLNGANEYFYESERRSYDENYFWG